MRAWIRYWSLPIVCGLAATLPALVVAIVIIIAGRI